MTIHAEATVIGARREPPSRAPAAKWPTLLGDYAEGEFTEAELSGFDAVVQASGLPPERASKAVSRLVDAGLVVTGDEGGLHVLGAAFARAARVALARPRSTEHADRPDDVRKVMEVFVVDGRITSIPTAHRKRLLLLDWLAQDFEPGVRYPERTVNTIIARRHADTAAWRRYLVDEEFLERRDGEYWRAGGTFA